MFSNHRLAAISLSGLLLLTGSVAVLLSQTAGRELLHAPVDEGRLVTLGGNTRPEMTAENDQGAVSDDLPLEHMMLQLKRSPEQEKEVERFVDELHNPNSPQFHKWITAAEFGQRFGAAQADIAKITDWLTSHGFTVNAVYPSQMVIDFSGDAGKVRGAFHISIHNLQVNGVHHIANSGDPQIPEALAAAVAGVVSLHDFRPLKMSRAKPNRGPNYTYTLNGQTSEAMVPADLATIYDFNPLFARGITGKGQTVVVIEDTNLYRTSDWTTFRNSFGLSQYATGTLTTVQPVGSGINNCASPGVNSDDEEAILDVEWASAAAPGATIELASCANTAVSDGILVAVQNAVNASPAPAIISISYGECEAYNGSASNLAMSSLFQQAVAEGTSVFVSSGDAGAAACDQDLTTATHGIGVSGFASTPYNVAVGGTDFSDIYSGTSSSYWSLNTNTATYGSALSYVPEIPWNDSCAGSLLAGSLGYSTGYGTGGFCGSSLAKAGGYLNTGGGSGGPSGCASGTPALGGVVGGSCKGFAKPSWQAGLSGIPNDGVRDIPDVSMFASDGFAWGHYSVICFTDAQNGGMPCRGAPSNWAGVGGTSLSSPVMAGVQALINQSVGGAQGNPNPVYYSLAVKAPSAFHSITQGDIDVNCNGAQNCFGYIGTVDYGRGGRIFGTTYGGVLSVSNTSFSPAYLAGTPWNFATGIGSVDVNNLVAAWPTK